MLEKAKTHYILLGIGTLLAGFSILSTVLFTTPASAGWLIYFLLYLSIFLFLLGLTTSISLFIRVRFFRGIYLINMLTSLRQGLLLAMLATAMLILQSHHLLFWWVAVSIVLFIFLLEIMFNL